jgi:hypothetical protein
VRYDNHVEKSRSLPPVISMSVSAAYLKRPENVAKGAAVKIQTAKKDFGPKGVDYLSYSTTSARNVDKWTGGNFSDIEVLNADQRTLKRVSDGYKLPPRPL